MSTAQIGVLAVILFLASMGCFARSTQLERAAKELQTLKGRGADSVSARLSSEGYEIVAILLFCGTIFAAGIAVIRWIA